MVGNKRGEIRKEVILRIIMLLLSALVLFPFLYCVAYSLSDSVAVMTTQITIFPVQPTFKNYSEVLNQRDYPDIVRAELAALQKRITQLEERAHDFSRGGGEDDYE